MTVEEFIQNSVEYYRNHPFGWDEEVSECAYIASDGSRCIVGRWLPEDVARGIEYGVHDDIVWNAVERYLPDVVRPKLWSKRELWVDVQRAHDRAAESKTHEARLATLEALLREYLHAPVKRAAL